MCALEPGLRHVDNKEWHGGRSALGDVSESRMGRPLVVGEPRGEANLSCLSGLPATVEMVTDQWRKKLKNLVTEQRHG
jgi:hypothetical protein